jgi:hypothetical protein
MDYELACSDNLPSNERVKLNANIPYCSFNDPVSRSDAVPSNSRNVSEIFIGKEIKGRSYDLM